MSSIVNVVEDVTSFSTVSGSNCSGLHVVFEYLDVVCNVLCVEDPGICTLPSFLAICREFELVHSVFCCLDFVHVLGACVVTFCYI